MELWEAIVKHIFLWSQILDGSKMMPVLSLTTMMTMTLLRWLVNIHVVMVMMMTKMMLTMLPTMVTMTDGHRTGEAIEAWWGGWSSAQSS